MQELRKRRPGWKRSLVAFITALALMMQSSLIRPLEATAAVADLSVYPGSQYAGEPSDPFVLSFTTDLGLKQADALTLTFPDGMVAPDITASEITISVSAAGYDTSVPQAVYGTPALSGEGSDILTIQLPVDVQANAVAPSTVKVHFPGRAKAGSGTSYTMMNPSLPGTYTVTVATPDGSKVNGAFTVVTPTMQLSPTPGHYGPGYTGTTITATLAQGQFASPDGITYTTALQVLNNSEQPISLSGASVRATGPITAEITLDPSVPADRYFFALSTANGMTAILPFELHPGLAPHQVSLPSGQAALGLEVTGTTLPPAPSVNLLDGQGKVIAGVGVQVDPTDAHRATLTLPPLALGQYEFGISTVGALQVRGSFEVVPGLAFSSSKDVMTAVTDQSSMIWVTGSQTNFGLGTTGTINGVAVEVQDYSATLALISTSPLFAGSYEVVITSGSQAAVGTLVVEATTPTTPPPTSLMTLSPDKLHLGYQGELSVSGPTFTFLPQLKIRLNGADVTGTSSVSLTNGKATITLAGGYGVGTYQVELFDNKVIYKDSFTISPTLYARANSEMLPLGYAPGTAIDFFIEGSTIAADLTGVRLTDRWGSDLPVTAQITRVSDTQATLTLKEGTLGLGQYFLELPTASGLMATGGFSVNPALSLTPNWLAEGYAAGTAIAGSAPDAHFSDGVTTLAVWTPQGEIVTPAGSSITAPDGITAKITLGGGLTAGTYTLTLKTATQTEVAIGTLTIGAAGTTPPPPPASEPVNVTLSPGQIYAGYTAQRLTVSGPAFSTAPELHILQGETEVTGTSSLTLSNGSAVITLQDGYTAGTYTVNLVANGQLYTGTFTLLTPSMRHYWSSGVPFGIPLGVDLIGTGTRWLSGAALTITDLAGSPVTTTTSLTVTSDTQATMTMGRDLPVGQYKAVVTTGAISVSATITIQPTLSTRGVNALVPVGYQQGAYVDFILRGSTFPADLTGWKMNRSGYDRTSFATPTRLSDTQVRIILNPGLGLGNYQVLVPTTSGILASGGFDVMPALSLDPASLTQGYAPDVTVTVSGTESHFLAGVTFPEVWTPSGSRVTPVGTGVTVIGATEAVLTLGGGLEPGTYNLVLKTPSSTARDEEAVGRLTVISPPRVTLAQNELLWPYGANTALEATGQYTHFDATTVLRVLDSTGADVTPEGTGLTVDAAAQKATLALGTGLGTGKYTLLFTTGTEQVKALLTIYFPAITLDEGAKHIWYNNSRGTFLVIGSYTRFDTATLLTIKDSTGTALDSAAYTYQVLDGARIQVNLNTDLPVGRYSVQVTQGESIFGTSFASQPQLFTVADNIFPVGYAAGTQVQVSIQGSTFGESTRVTLRTDRGVEVTPAGTSVVVEAPDRARISLGSGLGEGFYLYYLTDVNGIESSNGINIVPLMLPSPMKLPAGYAAGTTVTGSVPGVYFDGSAPRVRIADANGQSYSGSTVTAANDGSETIFTITLDGGLAPGKYRLYLSRFNGPDEVMGYLQVGLVASLSPASLTEGYTWPVTIAVTGEATHFDSGTAVEIVDAGNNRIATGENLQVTDATHLSFVLNQRLWPTEYKVRVITGSETAHGSLTVNRHPINLVAALKDAQGNPVANAGVEILPLAQFGNWEYAFHAETDAAGQLRTGLPAGDYAVRRWDLRESDRVVLTYIPFSIVSETDARLNPNLLTAPAPNLSGSVTEGGVALANASIYLVPLADDSTRLHRQGSWVRTSSSGTYQLYLRPGAYSVIAIDTGSAHRQWDQPFTVGESPVLLNLELPVNNLSGAVEWTNSTKVASAWLLIRSADPAVAFETWTNTDANGLFTASLADGAYYVATVWTDTNHEFDKSTYPITVSGGVATFTGPVVLALPNVQFQISGQASGHIRINWTDSNGTNERWLSFSDSTLWATFADGSYKVTALSGESWTEVSVPFTVAGGVPSANPILVAPAQPNLSGTAYDEAGQPVAEGWIWFRSITGTWKGTPTTGTGGFSLYLDPAEQWKVSSVGGASTYYEPTQMTWFTLPVTNMVVRPDQPNLTGVVKNLAGQAVSEAWVAIGPTGTTNQTADWQDVTWIRTRADGSFSALMPDGSYTIFQVWTGSTGFEVRVDFTISATAPARDLLVQPPQPNVTGTVLNANGQVVTSAWVGIRPAQLSDADGSSFKWTQTDEKGQFRFVLPAGSLWTLRFVQTSSSWDEYQISFGAPDLTVSDPLSLAVQPPQKNITGTVRNKTGALMPNVGVAIRSVDGNQHYWAGTDAQGAFAISLPAGSYVAYGISTSSRWIETNLAFTADADPLTPPTAIAVQEPVPNVTGTAYAADGSPVANGWVAFQPTASIGDWTKSLWVMTDALGRFEATLADGNWQVVNIQGGANGAYYDLLATGQRFTVPALSLVVAPPANNVSGTVYKSGTTPAQNAWVVIRPAGASRSDWSNATWVQTDGSGNFSLALREGSYAVTNVYGPDFSYESNIAFTAPNAAVTVAPPASQVSGTANITTASLAIRPVASINDASTTIWVEVKGGAWNLILEDGDYAVVAVDDGLSRFGAGLVNVNDSGTNTFRVTGGSATVHVVVTQQ